MVVSINLLGDDLAQFLAAEARKGRRDRRLRWCSWALEATKVVWFKMVGIGIHAQERLDCGNQESLKGL